MLRIVVMALACLLATLGFAGCGKKEPTDPLVLGKKVYVKNCATCHGPQGQGGIGLKLGGGQVVERYPNPADQTMVIVTGRGAMPAWGGILTAEQIAAVVQYTREQLGR